MDPRTFAYAAGAVTVLMAVSLWMLIPSSEPGPSTRDYVHKEFERRPRPAEIDAASLDPSERDKRRAAVVRALEQMEQQEQQDQTLQEDARTKARKLLATLESRPTRSYPPRCGRSAPAS